MPRIVKIEFHLQIANNEGRMETSMIGAIACFNCYNDPVDALLKSPKIDIKLKAFVLSGLRVPVENCAHSAGPICLHNTDESSVSLS
jgi:hypothetical protein